MSTRKFEYGYSKLKKKKRIHALIESQKGDLDRFIKTNKNKYGNIGNCSLNEQVNNVETDENENRKEVLVNEQVNNVVIDENEDSENYY